MLFFPPIAHIDERMGRYILEREDGRIIMIAPLHGQEGRMVSDEEMLDFMKKTSVQSN